MQRYIPHSSDSAWNQDKCIWVLRKQTLVIISFALHPPVCLAICSSCLFFSIHLYSQYKHLYILTSFGSLLWSDNMWPESTFTQYINIQTYQGDSLLDTTATCSYLNALSVLALYSFYPWHIWKFISCVVKSCSFQNVVYILTKNICYVLVQLL